MTPKEKAEQLFDKYDNYPLIREWKKRCAMIAVDEILELTKRNTYNPFDWNEITGVRYDNYWQEVKEEIEKL